MAAHETRMEDVDQQYGQSSVPPLLMSPDLARNQQLADQITAEVHQRAEQEKHAAEFAQAQAQAAAQQQQASTTGFFKHIKSMPGVDANAASQPFSFVDQFSGQAAIHRLFCDALARIRRQNAQRPPHTHPKIPQQELVLLQSILPKDLENALSIVDDPDKLTTFLGGGSKRVFWHVRGSGGAVYTTTQFHCTCPAFLNGVVIHNEKLYCKHQIAVLLADALNIDNKLIHLTDVQLGTLLFQADTSVSQPHRGGGGGWSRRAAGGGGGGSGH